MSFAGSLYQAIRTLNPPGVAPDTDTTAWRFVSGGNGSAGGGGVSCASPRPGANLIGCQFTTAPNALKDKDLTGANLSKSLVIGDLGSIDLTGAKILNAFWGQVGQGNVFQPVILSSSASLAYADLSGLYTTGNAALQAQGVNFRRATITDAQIQGANLQGANFNGANLEASSFGGAHMEGADLSNAKVKGTDYYYAFLSDANLSGVNLSEAAPLEGVDLTRATIAGADLRKSFLTNVNLTGAYLGYSNLSGAHIQNVTIGNDPTTGDTNFEYATCPDNTYVDTQIVTTCVGHGF